MIFDFKLICFILIFVAIAIAISSIFCSAHPAPHSVTFAIEIQMFARCYKNL